MLVLARRVCRTHRLEVRAHVARRARVHHPPVTAQNEHAVEQLEGICARLVNAHHAGDATLPESAQDPQHAGAIARVEAAGRLVEKEQARLRQQLRSDAHTTSLAAGQPAAARAANRPTGHLLQAQAGHQLAHPPLALLAPHLARQPQSGVKQQILEHRRGRRQRILLRHVA